MSDYKKKRKALTPELWDWIQAKHRAGWDACYIAEDSGFSRSTIYRVIHGQMKRPDELAPREDEDRGAYLPSANRKRRLCRLFRERQHQLLRPQTSFGGIREVSFHGHRRASTVGGTT